MPRIAPVYCWVISEHREGILDYGLVQSPYGGDHS